MKPEVVTFLFDYYLSKKHDTSLRYDAVEDVSYTKRRVELQGFLAGEPGYERNDRRNELMNFLPACISPDEHRHVPLGRQQERQQERQLTIEEEGRARRFARQFSNRFDEFQRTTERVSGNTFQFEKCCLFVSPSSDKVEIPVVRVGNAQKEAMVAWKTRDKSAQAGVHYVGSEGNVFFREGEMKKVIEIRLPEKHEDISFIVELLPSDFTEIGSVNPLTVNITDRERNTFQFEKRCLFVSPSSDKVEIPVIRVGNAQNEATVGWKTRDKTAQAGVHYVGSEGNILFREGEMKKVIEILLPENHEDIRFIVELLPSEFTEIGSANPLTVNITDHEHLYPDEKNVIENIIESRIPTLTNVIDCLLDKVTVNTFKTALMYMCSNANSFLREFVVAFELVIAALPSARCETLMQIVCDYFQQAPELEELDIEETESSEEEEDGSSEEEDSDEESE